MRKIVQLEHDIKRRLQTVIIDSFRRRHVNCQFDDVVAESSDANRSRSLDR